MNLNLKFKNSKWRILYTAYQNAQITDLNKTTFSEGFVIVDYELALKIPKSKITDPS